MPSFFELSEKYRIWGFSPSEFWINRENVSKSIEINQFCEKIVDLLVYSRPNLMKLTDQNLWNLFVFKNLRQSRYTQFFSRKNWITELWERCSWKKACSQTENVSQKSPKSAVKSLKSRYLVRGGWLVRFLQNLISEMGYGYFIDW